MTTEPTDMRDAILSLCNADRHAQDIVVSQGHCSPLRELIAAADCSRWYEQLSAAEQEEHREL